MKYRIKEAFKYQYIHKHLDHERNEDILTELQISQITQFIYQYRKNWKEHVDRMSSDRIPNLI
jgi:hypothetical protein